MNKLLKKSTYQIYMNFEIGNVSLLAIFFLYLVLTSSNLNGLLACNLQRELRHSMFLQHVLVYLSILFFTFILKWFVVDSIHVSHLEKMEESQNVENEWDYLKESLSYTTLIYVLFLLTTKQTIFHMKVFLILLFVLLLLFLRYLILIDKNKLTRNEIKTFFVNKQELDEKLGENADSLYYLHNTISLGYVALVTNILVGVYRYYLKQRSEQKNWDTIKFFFGTNHCIHK